MSFEAHQAFARLCAAVRYDVLRWEVGASVEWIDADTIGEDDGVWMWQTPEGPVCHAEPYDVGQDAKSKASEASADLSPWKTVGAGRAGVDIEPPF